MKYISEADIQAVLWKYRIPNDEALLAEMIEFGYVIEVTGCPECHIDEDECRCAE